MLCDPETQFAYSDPYEDGTVDVYVERPRYMGFDSAICRIPAFKWRDIDGFTEEDMKELDTFVRNNAPLIMEFAENPDSERLLSLCKKRGGGQSEVKALGL